MNEIEAPSEVVAGIGRIQVLHHHTHVQRNEDPRRGRPRRHDVLDAVLSPVPKRAQLLVQVAKTLHRSAERVQETRVVRRGVQGVRERGERVDVRCVRRSHRFNKDMLVLYKRHETNRT